MAGSSHQKARLEPAVGDDVVDRCAGRNRSSPAAGRRYVSRYFKKHLFMRALRNALQSSHRFFSFLFASPAVESASGATSLARRRLYFSRRASFCEGIPGVGALSVRLR